jgi:hypothetical protein
LGALNGTPTDHCAPQREACLKARGPASAPTCDETLNLCDAALKGKQRELDLSDLGIKIRQDEIERLQKRNAALEDRGTAWYSNPMVWAALGVIVGTWVGARATR